MCMESYDDVLDRCKVPVAVARLSMTLRDRNNAVASQVMIATSL